MVYVFLADGFEEVEALTFVDVMRRAGIQTLTVDTGKGSGEVTGSHGIKVMSDISIDDADLGKCSMIMLPGGMPGTLNLASCDKLIAGIKDFAEAGEEGGKYIAAICAAPMILGDMGLLDGKRAVIYPGMEEHLKGAFVMKNRVVVDGGIITSKGPGSAMEFAVEACAVLKGKETAEELMDQLVMRR